jgi:dihydroflavonol-4-reductase
VTKSLVTGGSGFIGRHLVEALSAHGDSIRIFDQAIPAASAGSAEFVQGSILDRASLIAALKGVNCVYHLAGIAHLWCRQVGDFDSVNRVGTETLLSAAAETGVARVVHCSTEAVLLPPQRSAEPIDETVSLQLSDMAGPYTRSKFAAEQAALTAARSGQPVVVVNPTLPIGSGDYNLTPPTAMLARLLGGQLSVSMDCVLNLADVRDMAKGFIRAAEHGRVGERYILGGTNMSMRDLHALLQRLSGKRPARFWIPSLPALAAGAACEWVANTVTHKMPAATIEGVQLALRSRPIDTSKARNELGTSVRPIEQSLAESVEWIAAKAKIASRAN